MPWCEPCGRYLTPNSVEADGSCPACGSTVEPASRAGAGAPDSVAAPAVGKVPWHFWVILALATLYLLWRVVQGASLLL